MKTEEWFPTLIHSDFINTNGLKEVAYNLKTKSDGVVNSNRGGAWQSYDVLKNEMFSEIINIIEQKALEIYNQKYKPGSGRYKVAGMWVNINGPKSYNIRHQHPRAELAGTLYVKTPENCGDIEFEDPKEIHRLYEENGDPILDNKYTWRSVCYKPENNLVLFFPGWLAHKVEENKSDDDRISISFNMIIDQKNYNIMKLIERQVNGQD
jgi:uncharacterized protein (TIGR02466 family)